MFGLNKKSTTIEDIEMFKDTRLNIVDEISFASEETLQVLSEKLQDLTECRSQIYGNIAIVFIGDFCQLPPISGTKIYSAEKSIYWEQALNQMVELDGFHRYNNDPEFGRIMKQARNGDVEDLKQLLKSRVIGATNSLEIPEDEMPRYATFTNKTRASINANIFKKYLETFHSRHKDESVPNTALIIRGAAKWSTTRIPLGFHSHKTLWENCSDGHVANEGKRCDPFLCLFSGCEVMVNENIDVVNGIANGTCCQFQKAVLKTGCNVKQIKFHGFWVNSVDIDEVEYILLRFDKSYKDTFQGQFRLKPQQAKFIVEYPSNSELGNKKRDRVHMEISHFPLLLNFATTGHKLQGKTMKTLIIAEWRNKQNWPYVVLSRVQSRDGLFLMTELPDHFSFTPPTHYLQMIDNLRENILSTT